MAIELEPERQGTNWMAIVTVAVIVIVLFVGSYYLFFKQPQLIEVVAPQSLQTLGDLSKVSFDPSAVVNDPTFKLLRQYGSPISPVTPGRSNPFQPF